MPTVTTGGATSGNSSVLSFSSANSPNTTSVIMDTTVISGFLIAKSEMNMGRDRKTGGQGDRRTGGGEVGRAGRGRRASPHPVITSPADIAWRRDLHRCPRRDAAGCAEQ